MPVLLVWAIGTGSPPEASRSRQMRQVSSQRIPVAVADLFVGGAGTTRAQASVHLAVLPPQVEKESAACT
jgi:hypothetical protein